MASWPNPALSLLLVAALLAFEDWLATPSCSGDPPVAHAPGDLRAMMVADLMLLGSDASYVDRYFRDHLMSKFFAFGVEKVLERENHHFQIESVNEEECYSLECGKRKGFADISWRRNNMKSGSGPVVLLHFPLSKSDGEVTDVPTFSEEIVSDLSSVSSSSKHSGTNGRRLYDRLHTLPSNSTQYILQALKPRTVFNAHAGSFSKFVHADGTLEVTVPAMTWKTGGLIGFVISTFGAKGDVTFGCCWLAQEWHVITGYLAFFCLTAIAVRWSH